MSRKAKRIGWHGRREDGLVELVLEPIAPIRVARRKGMADNLQIPRADEGGEAQVIDLLRHVAFAHRTVAGYVISTPRTLISIQSLMPASVSRDQIQHGVDTLTQTGEWRVSEGGAFGRMYLPVDDRASSDVEAENESHG